ncbi:MAG: hypothetical protein E6713_06885 [Sporomusaceae bacterium]|nr:hypothetical protein [Sporomusaceae bacterium]
MKIKNPQWLQVSEIEKAPYGFSQYWYSTDFKRTRGCGPRAAAMQLAYVSRREQDDTFLCDNTVEATQLLMEKVWDFITPGRFLGLNSTEKFCSGMSVLLRYYHLPWQCQRMSVPLLSFQRPGLAEVIAFIEAGLALDCPVAFLNLQRGQAITTDSWHWTILVALEKDSQTNQYQATCYDNGRSITFDLGLWLKTTKLGGGFVYLTTDLFSAPH